MNKTIVKCLSEAAKADQRLWPNHVHKVTYSYNMMRQESTGFSSYRLMYGREAKTPLSLIFPAMQKANPLPMHHFVRTQVADMARVNDIVRKNVQTAQLRQARNHDKRISNTPFLKPGQWAMLYIDTVKKDHIGKMTRKWRGPWQVIKTYGPGVGYLFHNGHKAHFERVRLYEPRMIDLKIGDNGNFVYLGSTEDPILEIFPEDSALDETWDPPHPLPEPDPLDVRKGPHRKCKEKKLVPPIETGSDTNFENPDYISPEFDPRLSETTQVPSRPNTPNEHSPQMSDVDNRAANLIFSDDDGPSIQARPDTDEEFWLHHWNSRNARRQDKETTPNQLLHEAQRDRILDYFYHSKALDASPEEVEKWVDNLIAADADAFVPDLFSDEDSNYSEEEFVVDKEYADMLRSESNESKKKFWLVQQCLQYRRKLHIRRRRGYETPSDYNSAAFWGDGREFLGQNPYEEGGGELDTPTANERAAQSNEEGGAPPNEPEVAYETTDDLDLQPSAEDIVPSANM